MDGHECAVHFFTHRGLPLTFQQMPALSSASCPEQLFLIGRRVDLQQIPLVAAAVEADAPLGITDELELSRLQLEVVHIELLVHTAGVEQELVGGDGKQRPGQLPDPIYVEVLQILAGQNAWMTLSFEPA